MISYCQFDIHVFVCKKHLPGSVPTIPFFVFDGKKFSWVGFDVFKSNHFSASINVAKSLKKSLKFDICTFLKFFL